MRNTTYVWRNANDGLHGSLIHCLTVTWPSHDHSPVGENWTHLVLISGFVLLELISPEQWTMTTEVEVCRKWGRQNYCGPFLTPGSLMSPPSSSSSSSPLRSSRGPASVIRELFSRGYVRVKREGKKRGEGGERRRRKRRKKKEKRRGKIGQSSKQGGSRRRRGRPICSCLFSPACHQTTCF